MKLRLYIVVSLLSHILLFGILIKVHPEVNTETLPDDIFNIDIVPPEKETSGDIKISPPKQPLKRKKFAPEKKIDETIPKTMFDAGEDSKKQTGELFSKHGFDGLNGSGKEPSGEEEILPKDAKGLPSDPRSFLFDKETVEKFANRGKAKEKSKDLTFDTSEFHHRGYMRRLKEKIESIWKYPERKARLGISGDLYIRFSIKRDGSLGEVHLVRTSGHKALDEAALKAVKDAEPYWPLPDDWEEDDFSITGHFIYIIGEFYLM